MGAPTHHEAVDEEVQDGDATYVKCVEGNTMLKVGLAPITPPRTKDSHEVRIWAMAIGAGKGESINGYLYQGTMLIAQVYKAKSISRIPDYAIAIRGPLDTDEAELITDYSLLELHFEYDSIGAGEEIRITMMEFQVPFPLVWKSPVIMWS
ncbi:MAG: hypothetical protein HWN68_06550 [Desulfobacterales bacterium]|nr:hypothetical protein [Desulfobacterales bacterium]